MMQEDIVKVIMIHIYNFTFEAIISASQQVMLTQCSQNSENESEINYAISS